MAEERRKGSSTADGCTGVAAEGEDIGAISCGRRKWVEGEELNIYLVSHETVGTPKGLLARYTFERGAQ